MPDWFDQNAPATSTATPAAADWFASNGPPPDAGDAKTFADHLAHYWHMVNPKEQAQGLATGAERVATTNPVTTASNIGKHTDDFRLAAVDSFKKGNYTEAARHAFTYLTNGVTLGLTGSLDEAGTDLVEGRIGEGVAKTAAIATNIIAGKKLGDVTNALTEPGAVATAKQTVTSAPARAAAAVKANIPSASGALSTIEKATTLSPAVQDAIEMVPGAGAPIAATARSISRAARTGQRVLQRMGGAELENRPVPQPGVQDPAAVEPRTPIIDTSTELTPEQEAAIATRQSAGPADWFEANAPTAAPYPGQQDPNAVQPMTPQIDQAVEATPIRTVTPPASVNPADNISTESKPAAPPETKPAELLDEIALGMSGKPFAKLSAGEQTGVLRVAGRLASKVSPPEAVAAAETPAPAATAAAQPEVAQPKLLDEPAYDRPVDEQGKPTKTDYQAAARTVKGRAMARLLHNPPEGPSITADEAATIPAEDPRWETIAKLAGVNKPSAASIQVAIDHLRELEAARAAPAPARAVQPAPPQTPDAMPSLINLQKHLETARRIGDQFMGPQ